MNPTNFFFVLAAVCALGCGGGGGEAAPPSAADAGSDGGLPKLHVDRSKLTDVGTAKAALDYSNLRSGCAGPTSSPASAIPTSTQPSSSPKAARVSSRTSGPRRPSSTAFMCIRPWRSRARPIKRTSAT
jgi:hypothetical protein